MQFSRHKRWRERNVKSTKITWLTYSELSAVIDSFLFCKFKLKFFICFKSQHNSELRQCTLDRKIIVHRSSWTIQDQTWKKKLESIMLNFSPFFIVYNFHTNKSLFLLDSILKRIDAIDDDDSIWDHYAQWRKKIDSSLSGFCIISAIIE